MFSAVVPGRPMLAFQQVNPKKFLLTLPLATEIREIMFVALHPQAIPQGQGLTIYYSLSNEKQSWEYLGSLLPQRWVWSPRRRRHRRSLWAHASVYGLTPARPPARPLVVACLSSRPSLLARTPWLDLQNPNVSVQFGLSLESQEFIRNVDEGRNVDEQAAVVRDIGRFLASPCLASVRVAAVNVSVFVAVVWLRFSGGGESTLTHWGDDEDPGFMCYCFRRCRRRPGIAIGKHLYTWMSSFAQRTGQFKDLGEVLLIPTSCIDKWWAKFREKQQRCVAAAAAARFLPHVRFFLSFSLCVRNGLTDFLPATLTSRSRSFVPTASLPPSCATPQDPLLLYAAQVTAPPTKNPVVRSAGGGATTLQQASLFVRMPV